MKVLPQLGPMRRGLWESHVKCLRFLEVELKRLMVVLFMTLVLSVGSLQLLAGGCVDQKCSSQCFRNYLSCYLGGGSAEVCRLQHDICIAGCPLVPTSQCP